MEAPGLDFGSSRSRFWTVLGSIFRNFRAFLASCLRNGCFTDTMPRKPKSGQIVAKMWAFISPCAFSTAVLHMQALKAWQSPKILAHKWGGGGGPPLGEFNGIHSKSMSQKTCDFSWIFHQFWTDFAGSWEGLGEVLGSILASQKDPKRAK